MFFFFKHLRICLLAGNINGEIAGEFTVGWFYFTEELKLSLRLISSCAYFLWVGVDFTCSTFFFFVSTLHLVQTFSSNFQSSVENNPGLLWFCYVLPCDWSRKLVPFSRPIRCKTITNHDLVPRALCGWLVFTLSSPIGSSGYFQSCYFYSKVYFEISLLFSSDSSIVSQPSRSEVDSPEFRVRLNVWIVTSVRQ